MSERVFLAISLAAIAGAEIGLWMGAYIANTKPGPTLLGLFLVFSMMAVAVATTIKPHD